MFSPIALSAYQLALTKRAKEAQGRRENPSTLNTVFKKNVPIWTKENNPNKLKMNDIRTQIAQNTLDASKVALETELCGVPIGGDLSPLTIEKVLTIARGITHTADKNNPDYTKLRNSCLEIVKILQTEKGQVTPKQMQLLREKLSDALYQTRVKTSLLSCVKAPGFNDRKQVHISNVELSPEFGIPLVKFLHCLSYQIKTQTEGMGVLEEIGNYALREYRTTGDAIEDTQPVTAKQLADDVEEVFHNMPADSWDRVKNWLIWALKNLAEALSAFLDGHTSKGHHSYNSYKQGNVDMWIGDFEVKGQKIHTHIGGSPTMHRNTQLTKAQIAWENAQGNLVHVIHPLESNRTPGESARMEEIGNLDRGHQKDKIQNLPLLTVMATPVDGKFAHGKENFAHIQSVDQYYEELEKEFTGEKLTSKRAIPENMRDYDGFAIPENLLNAEEIKEVIVASKEAFKAVMPEETLNSYHDKKQHERLCTAMLVGFTGFLSIKMMMKLGDQLKGMNDVDTAKTISATLERECKQCADRGPLINATIIAFTKMIENGKLDGRDQKQITGLLVGRAMIAAGERKMVKNRREAFIDLFKIIGRDSEKEKIFVAKLQQFVGKKEGEESPIQFTPSHHVIGSP
jgi:hypothetical protein